MSIIPAIDVFQSEINSLFHDLDFVKVYIDDILIVSHKNEEDHLEKVNIVLERLKQADLKAKIQKCTLLQPSVEYLGFKLSIDGIHPLRNKIDALVQMRPPTTRKQLKGFLGMFNYYR